jgi:hypothetical protein
MFLVGEGPLSEILKIFAAPQNRSSTAPDHFDGKNSGRGTPRSDSFGFIFRAGVTSPSGTATAANGTELTSR